MIDLENVEPLITPSLSLSLPPAVVSQLNAASSCIAASSQPLLHLASPPLVRFLLRSGREYDSATLDADHSSSRFLGFLFEKQPFNGNDKIMTSLKMGDSIR